jgi:hypothetical protein
MKAHALGFVTLAALGIVLLGCSGGPDRDDSGQIVEEGDLGVFDFKVGDCFQDPENLSTGSAGVADVSAVPCTVLHDNEVFALFDVSGRFDSWPGTPGLETVADEVCFDAFEPYVGLDFESSRLSFVWLLPSQETWEENDDREVVCILYDVELAKLTGSMRNSGE